MIEIRTEQAHRLEIGDVVGIDGEWVEIVDIESADAGEGVELLTLWTIDGYGESIFSTEMISRQVF